MKQLDTILSIEIILLKRKTSTEEKKIIKKMCKTQAKET